MSAWEESTLELLAMERCTFLRICVARQRELHNCLKMLVNFKLDILFYLLSKITLNFKNKYLLPKKKTIFSEPNIASPNKWLNFQIKQNITNFFLLPNFHFFPEQFYQNWWTRENVTSWFWSPLFFETRNNRQNTHKHKNNTFTSSSCFCLSWLLVSGESLVVVSDDDVRAKGFSGSSVWFYEKAKMCVTWSLDNWNWCFRNWGFLSENIYSTLVCVCFFFRFFITL